MSRREWDGAASQGIERDPKRRRTPWTPDGFLAPAAVAYLRSLHAMWADSGPEGRQALANALFAKLEVLGYRRMEYELTPGAIELGLNAALPAVLEVGEHESGRGERDSPATSDLPITMRLAEPPEPFDWLRSA